MQRSIAEWVAIIKTAISDAYEAGAIQTFEDFDRISREAGQSMQTDDETLIARAVLTAKINHPVMTALRRKAVVDKAIRRIILEQGEIFKTEFTLEGQARITIFCGGKALIILAKKVIVTAEG